MVALSVAFFSLTAFTQASALDDPESVDPEELQPEIVETYEELQEQINEILNNTDGGVQISDNEIAWDGGEVIMSLPLPGQVEAPPSSPEAIRLQAQISGVPLAEVLEAAASNIELAASDSCPTEVFGNDWYCFYQHPHYEGRRLQWNARKLNMVYFSAYDFVNKTSSWSNRGGKIIYVYGRTKSGDDSSCNNSLWIEMPKERLAIVPKSLDNRADCFRTGE
ncbi:peptidase inhibitor family I36 protein [Streptomyces xiamenensis]|uniref:peptidase inhibitor family I36 protein n=1 Tax=Streptomyces xiamenensis TaxID=408015 RepID=UPI0036E8D705